MCQVAMLTYEYFDLSCEQSSSASIGEMYRIEKGISPCGIVPIKLCAMKTIHVFAQIRGATGTRRPR